MTSDSYAAARIHAMRRDLIGKEEYARLLRMTEKEILNYLQTTGYRDDIGAIAFKDLDDLETVDLIIARHSDRIMRKLRRIASTGFREALELSLRENDLWNIKVVASAIAGGKSEGGNDPRTALKCYAKQGTEDPMRYAAAKTIERLGEMVARRYGVKPARSFAALNDTIDELAAKSAAPPKDARSARDKVTFIVRRHMADERNIKAIIMQKRDGVPARRIVAMLIPGGTITQRTLRKAADAPDATGAFEALKDSEYARVLTRGQQHLEHGRMYRFEYELRHTMLRHIRRAAGRYPLGVEVLLRYMDEKDIELANIRLLLKGKHLALEQSFLQEQLIA